MRSEPNSVMISADIAWDGWLEECEDLNPCADFITLHDDSIALFSSEFGEGMEKFPEERTPIGGFGVFFCG
jgi:hypothetical protein